MSQSARSARVISVPSCEACPEPNHPEASLSHFKTKTDRCPCPEVAFCTSGEFCQPQTLPFLVLSISVFPKPSFLRGQIVNEATNSPSKTWQSQIRDLSSVKRSIGRPRDLVHSKSRINLKRTSCKRTPTTSLGFFTHFPSGTAVKFMQSWRSSNFFVHCKGSRLAPW